MRYGAVGYYLLYPVTQGMYLVLDTHGLTDPYPRKYKGKMDKRRKA